MSESANMDLWHRVGKTDPKHVKPITGKQYKGNSPKPYYIVQRLTEEFGPCGIGWGMEIQKEYMHLMPDNETTLHVAVVQFWYRKDGEVCGCIQQVGQTKASYKSNSGNWVIDEDAPKKSVTDALIKCASYLGFAGDIFMGMWDDSKYVEVINKDFREEEKKKEVEQWEHRKADLHTMISECVTIKGLQETWATAYKECASRGDKDGESELRKVKDKMKEKLSKVEAVDKTLERELEGVINEDSYQ